MSPMVNGGPCCVARGSAESNQNRFVMEYPFLTVNGGLIHMKSLILSFSTLKRLGICPDTFAEASRHAEGSACQSAASLLVTALSEAMAAGRRASRTEGKATQGRSDGTPGEPRRDCATCMHLGGWRDLRSQTDSCLSDRCTPGLAGTF